MLANPTNHHPHGYQPQRLEALGLMTNSIVHDFNNLLASIVGQASLALMKLPPGSDAQSHIEKTIQAAQYASLLTRQLLSYSSGDGTKVEIIDPNQLIQDNVGLLDVVFLAGITLQLDLAPQLPFIEANRAQIQQVLMNLLINAAEAIRTLPGLVKVETGVQRFSAHNDGYAFVGQKEPLPGEYVFIEVSDTGVGMDEATLAHIFDPFYSTKPNGRGLGLSAVLEIVHSLNGVVAIQSQLQQGTIFTVFLPVIPHGLNHYPTRH